MPSMRYCSYAAKPGREKEEQARRAFGVVLDAYASTDRTTLGKALGAVTSYAAARNAPGPERADGREATATPLRRGGPGS